MPNWCYNELTVSGSHKELERFLDASIGLPAIYPDTKYKAEELTPQFCFNALVPTPEEVLQTGYSGLYKLSPADLSAIYSGSYSGPLDGYHWNIMNWGTKWDIFGDGITKESIEWEEDSDSIFISFYSAWSPPEAWLKYAVEQFPALDFKMHYEESGCYFAGDYRGEEGVLTDHPYEGEELEAFFSWEEDEE